MVGDTVRYTHWALDDSDDDRYLALQREMDKAWRKQSQEHREFMTYIKAQQERAVALAAAPPPPQEFKIDALISGVQQLTTEQRHLATLTATTSIRKLTALEDRTTHRTEQAQVGADAAATATDAAECLDRPARA